MTQGSQTASARSVHRGSAYIQKRSVFNSRRHLEQPNLQRCSGNRARSDFLFFVGGGATPGPCRSIWQRTIELAGPLQVQSRAEQVHTKNMTRKYGDAVGKLSTYFHCSRVQWHFFCTWLCEACHKYTINHLAHSYCSDINASESLEHFNYGLVNLVILLCHFDTELLLFLNASTFQ